MAHCLVLLLCLALMGAPVRGVTSADLRTLGPTTSFMVRSANLGTSDLCWQFGASFAVFELKPCDAAEAEQWFSATSLGGDYVEIKAGSWTLCCYAYLYYGQFSINEMYWDPDGCPDLSSSGEWVQDPVSGTTVYSGPVYADKGSWWRVADDNTHIQTYASCITPEYNGCMAYTTNVPYLSPPQPILWPTQCDMDDPAESWFFQTNGQYQWPYTLLLLRLSP